MEDTTPVSDLKPNGVNHARSAHYSPPKTMVDSDVSWCRQPADRPEEAAALHAPTEGPVIACEEGPVQLVQQHHMTRGVAWSENHLHIVATLWQTPGPLPLQLDLCFAAVNTTQPEPLCRQQASQFPALICATFAHMPDASLELMGAASTGATRNEFTIRGIGLQQPLVGEASCYLTEPALHHIEKLPCPVCGMCTASPAALDL